MKIALAILLTLAVAIPATWFVTSRLRQSETAPSSVSPVTKRQRKILYYQSPMHPWIKSDKPGRCTICGMELTPVYEGDPGFDASSGDIIPLTQTMIQVMNVQTAEATTQPLEKTLTVAGTIEEDATRHRVLSAYIPGRIQTLQVNYQGAEVKEGQPLAEFYSPALLQSEREYRALTGDLREAVALRLRQMGLTPAQIQDLPNKPADKLTSQILAPIGGTVVAQSIYEGQYVQEGEKLFEIADFSTMWFQFRAYEQDLPWLKRGLPVEVTTPAHPSFVYTGQVAFIEPTLDEATRSVRVRVELKNPPPESGHRLQHKLYADGVVHLEAPKVLAVPKTAVIQTGPDAVAYVEQLGPAYNRRVLTLGRRGDSLIEVASGLSEGEKVVVNGNLLIDGQAEMNRAFGPAPAHPVSSSTTNTIPLTENQRRAAEQFIKVVDAISAALAKDDVKQFNDAGPAAMKATDDLVEQFKDRAELEDILKHLSDARHLHGAADLAAARKMFHPFANATAKVFDLLGGAPGLPALQMFECSMVDRAIPGVPKNGRWVQAAGREMANPYFGSEMLDCGTKVKR